MLRADAFRQGRRPRRSVAADLAGLGHRPRHQGRELDADRRLSRAAWPRAAVRSDQRGVRRLQSAARSAPRRMGSPRRPERRRRAGRSRRLAGAPEPLGEDQPLAAGRRHPACPLRRGGQDARRRRRLPLRSEASDRDDAEGDDDDAASRRRGTASRRGVHGARAPEQIRQRAIRRALDRHVVPRPLSRSCGRRGHAALRLAHHGPHRRRSPGDALPRRPALRHQPHQAADPPGAEPDRPAADRGPACQEPASSRAADARRVSGARPARFLRERARLHGRLRPQGVPDRAVAEPDREGLRRRTIRSSTIAMSA